MITEREINGVRCFGVERPGKLPKELLVQFILRSGVRDQAFHEEELAHLVEHILLSAVDDSEITVQGTTGLTCTDLTFVGESGAVQRAVAQLCDRIDAIRRGELTDAEIKRELGILEHEGNGGCIPPALAEMLGARCGVLGVGRAWSMTNRAGQLTPAEVQSWVTKFCVAENARVSFVGELPHDFTINLPRGEAQPVPHDQCAVATFPAEFLSGGATSVSWVVPPGLERRRSVGTAVMALLDARFMQLRRDHGTVYGVDPDPIELSDGSLLIGLHIQCTDKSAPEAVNAVLGVVRDLASNGAAPGELDAAQSAMKRGRGLIGPDVISDIYASFDLVGVLAEAPSYVSGDLGLTDAELAHVFSQFETTLLVGFPEYEGRADQDMVLFDSINTPVAPTWPAHGSTHTRSLTGRFQGAPKDYRVTIDDTGITEYYSDRLVSIRWSDVVGLDLLGEPDDLPLAIRAVDALGRVVDPVMGHLKNGSAVARAVVANVPQRLHLWVKTEDGLW